MYRTIAVPAAVVSELNRAEVPEQSGGATLNRSSRAPNSKSLASPSWLPAPYEIGNLNPKSPCSGLSTLVRSGMRFGPPRGIPEGGSDGSIQSPADQYCFDAKSISRGPAGGGSNDGRHSSRVRAKRSVPAHVFFNFILSQRTGRRPSELGRNARRLPILGDCWGRLTATLLRHQNAP